MRTITSKEEAVLRYLLKDIDVSFIADDYFVEEMKDGGMGSLRFYLRTSIDKKVDFARELVRAEYTDKDGVKASIVINSDELENLYELDIWKVDFSSLKKFPNIDDLENIEINVPPYRH